MADYEPSILLDADKAYFYSETSKSLVTDETVVRYWKNIDRNDVEALAAILRARRSYTNPKVGQRTYSGTWYIRSVQTKDTKSEGFHIYEELVKGFATTIPNAGARLVRVQAEPNLGLFKLTRRWPYIDPNTADTLITGLKNTLTVTDPQADSQAYSGTFAIGKVWGDKESDGSVTIYQELSEFDTTWDASNPEDLITDGVADVFDYKGDPKAVNNIGTRETDVELTLQINNLNPANGKAILDAYNVWDAFKNSTIVTRGNQSWDSGWYIAHNPEFKKMADGTGRLTVTFTKSTSVAGADFSAYEDRSVSSYTSSKTPSGSASTATYVNSPTEPTAITGISYGSLSKSKTPYGRWNGQRTVQTYNITALPSEADTWDVIRTRFEKTYTKPADNIDDDITPVDGYWWRPIDERISCKITYSNSTAKTFINGGRYGSFVKYLKRGLWYAEKVTSRTIGSWYATKFDSESLTIST